MARGRPPKGLDHVDSLPGEPEEKERLKVVLATLVGELPVEEGCRRLSISSSRLHELRRQALLGMLRGLAPRPAGRPPKAREPEEVRELRERVAWLEEELQISRLRTEIALWKPSLLRAPQPPGEKGGSSSKPKRGRGSRPKRDGRDDT